MRAIGSALFAVCALLGFAPSALTHGGVYLEDDLCVIKVGFYQAHFTIFQPATSGHEQFCEDLPEPTESVFVLEYLHDGLEALPVDFRIIENTTNMGLYASWEDIEQIADLDAVTVFYQPPQREPDVFTVLHEFTDPGQFIGIVTSRHPETDALYRAVFPFEVGFVGVNYLAIGGALVLSALALWVGWLLRGLWRNRAATAVVALLAAGYATHADAVEPGGWVAEGNHYRVEAEPQLTPFVINRMHKWHIRVLDAEGNPVNDAAITVGGGMPQHDHGLPTRPELTGALGDGVYEISGIKFHMRGAWVVVFTISANGVSEAVTLDLEL